MNLRRCMQIFEDAPRTRPGPKAFNESSFEYVNSAARPGFHAIREMLEQWFQRYPDTQKNDLRARLRKRNDIDHNGAFFELWLHELLICHGFRVEAHPAMPESDARPDFLVAP